MMFSNDFGKEFGEEREMPAELHEKTPGVYVRAENELPHELDMLWSKAPTYQREERSPLISFLAGVLVGAVLTAAVFMLFVMKPEIKTDANEITAPISEDLPADKVATPVQNKPEATKQESQPLSEKRQAGTGLSNVGGTTYTVVSGDTLSGIAKKMYGSSDPQYVEKIQRANSLKSADSLQLDQRLIIPPKNY